MPRLSILGSIKNRRDIAGVSRADSFSYKMTGASAVRRSSFGQRFLSDRLAPAAMDVAVADSEIEIAKRAFLNMIRIHPIGA